MSIMRINKCGKCHRKAELTERNGGWTVDCYYSNPLNGFEDKQDWCNVERDYKLFDTPNKAILAWNKKNPEIAS